MSVEEGASQACGRSALFSLLALDLELCCTLAEGMISSALKSENNTINVGPSFKTRGSAVYGQLDSAKEPKVKSLGGKDDRCTESCRHYKMKVEEKPLEGEGLACDEDYETHHELARREGVDRFGQSLVIIISAFVGVAFFCDGGLSLRLDLLLLLDKYLELSGRECVKEEKRI
ncbi:hypothetical protein Csa_011932 [Cucumis sativus]|nr:hypothetical protein Csa_011932 [Cucumis sativus]